MRTLARASLILAAGAALSGCAIFKTTYGDSGSASDGGSSDGGNSSDGGSTADGGSSADGGTETDGGAGDGGTTGDGGSPGDGGGTDGGGDDLCDDDVTTFPPEDGCVTDTLSCGQTITANIHSGFANYDADAYGAWYCTVNAGDTWDGPERIYAFQHPGTGTIELELNSPCSDLDLVAVRWGWWASDGECPSADTTGIIECEMDESSGGGSITLYATEPSDYLVIVDSVDGASDIFQLSASCP